MTTPKYSRIEHERRFLVSSAQRSLCVGDHVQIRDCYIIGTRLRVRSVTPSNGGAPTFKLCKKYGHLTGSSEPIVNIYLTEDENQAFANLPGAMIEKRRYHRDAAGVRVAVDVFDGALSGLILAEIEVADAAKLAAMLPPPWAIREVTGDPWFRGGHLATVTAEMLHRPLQAISES